MTSPAAPGAAPSTASASASASVVYRARFDECTPDGTLRTSALLRWAQDVAWIHSTALGYGREWYRDHGLAWLVRGVDLTVRAAIATSAELAVTTRVVGWRRVWARRRTTVLDTQGALVATILTDWVMTDERGAPTRVPAEFAQRFAADGMFTPVRLAPLEPPAGALAHRSVVRPQELDPMGHVNNAAYVDYLEEALLASPAEASSMVAIPRRYRLEYLAPAASGAPLVAHHWRADGEIAYLLALDADRPEPAGPGGLARDRARDLLRARVSTWPADDPNGGDLSA